MSTGDGLGWTCDEQPFVSWVPVTLDDALPAACPERFRPRISVVVLHDGEYFPRRLAENPSLSSIVSSGELRHSFRTKRDWGASLVAESLSGVLGLGGYHRVNVARVAVDFNRFPGSTPRYAEHLNKLAISGYLARDLGHADKRWMLETLYDGLSGQIEQAISGRNIVLSIHTYDERNQSDTQRPEVSLLGRSHSYQHNSQLPEGLFDPLFPSVLVESTVKRLLRDRISLSLQKGGVYVEHNYPYCLPDGSLEIRSQPWYFFRRLRRHFESIQPESASSEAYRTVWAMLLNTNLRSAEANALSAYLHRYLEPPVGKEQLFEQALGAYGSIVKHLEASPDLVDEYRFSERRTSALTIEVRKDLLADFEDGWPRRFHTAKAREIGRLIAQGVGQYVRQDRLPSEA